MPKTRHQNQRKRQQRAMQKRTRRSVKRARRSFHDASSERPTSVLRHAREFPIAGCWVQPGWQQYGTASLLVARTQPTDEIVFARYLVDTFCLGLKHTFYGVNIDPVRFNSEILPRLYQGEPPTSLNVEVAHEIVYGAIEYAEGIGFRAHRNFRRTQQLLDPSDAHPHGGSIEFGYRGRPAYLPSSDDNQRAILNRLVQTVGKGNFLYFPPDGPLEGYEDLVEQAGQPEEQSPIWTPRQESPGGRLDDNSGLWSPGQPEEPAPEAEAPSRPSLWTPGT